MMVGFKLHATLLPLITIIVQSAAAFKKFCVLALNHLQIVFTGWQAPCHRVPGTTAALYSGLSQLCVRACGACVRCVRAQPCMQGSGDAACLPCMLVLSIFTNFENTRLFTAL
jgi:hypothetical protein